MNTIREIEKINNEELALGLAGTPASWHAKYSQSAWVYVGNLDHELSEGDILCVMSQFGEIEDIHLVREDETGKSRGFAFVKYEDSRSCVLAVDNFVGSKLLGRSIRIDHVERYKLPKKLLEQEEGKSEREVHYGAGHAYKNSELADPKYTIQKGQDLFDPTQRYQVEKPSRMRIDPDSTGKNRKHRKKRKEDNSASSKEERRTRRKKRQRTKERKRSRHFD